MMNPLFTMGSMVELRLLIALYAVVRLLEVLCF